MFVGVLWPTGTALAHGGGLDASGCHHDRKHGDYHCHRRPSQPTPPPPAPEYVAPPAVVPVIPVYTTPSLSSALIPPMVGVAQVLDGDTIQIGTQRIRLYGIDAFESEQLCKTSEDNTYGCGGRATRALEEKIAGSELTCVAKGQDAYGRQLAVCRVEATDLSSWLTRQGHAVAYIKYALDYVSDEQFAKATKAGAWGGTFELPWEYRLGRPSGAAEAQRQSVAPSDTCRIKGNVNKDGARIYHLPRDPFYTRTRPENWFCTVGEAEQAGFRRAGSPR
jgi:endonuclease YncB( thermonuclease family)